MNKGSVDYENNIHPSVLRFSTKILKILHLVLKLLNNMALITLSSSGCDHMEFFLWLCIRLGWYEWFVMATLGLFQGGGILRLTG